MSDRTLEPKPVGEKYPTRTKAQADAELKIRKRSAVEAQRKKRIAGGLKARRSSAAQRKLFRLFPDSKNSGTAKLFGSEG